jgi:RNA polymerase-binding transcription factor
MTVIVTSRNEFLEPMIGPRRDFRIFMQEASMTKNDVQKFRTTLEATVIEFDSSRRREAIRIEQTADVLDRTIQAGERELAVQSLEAVSRKQREAAAALRRIDAGIYGTCQECEEPIGAARLAAIPWAALCIRCQRAADCRCGTNAVWPQFEMAA